MTLTYINFIQSTFETVLLPHNVLDGHYIVFQVVFKPESGRPYIKIWDSFDIWEAVEPKKIPQVLYLLGGFFTKDTEVMVHVNRADHDPEQGDTHGCAAFAFFTLAHLALNLNPPATTAEDEAVLRNYLLGCIVQGKFLATPDTK